MSAVKRPRTDPVPSSDPAPIRLLRSVRSARSTHAPHAPHAPRWRLPADAQFIGVALAFVGILFAAGAPSPLFVVYQQAWRFPAWVLTVAFAVYAVTLLATLLVGGSLSDYLGRRPVLIGALVVETIAMALFVVAPNIGWIIAARAIQGSATGAATGAFTAAVVELAPERRKQLGALIGSAAPTGGLALGAFVTGCVIQFSHAPSIMIFSFLTAVFIAGALVVYFSAETGKRRPGALRSLIPHVAIPSAARRAFSASSPALVATWMLGGLVLGLAPSILRGVFHIASGLASGALVALLPATATVAGLALGRVRALAALSFGATMALVGAAAMVVGVLVTWFPLLVLGALLGGAGFGAVFSGVVRTLAPLAPVPERAGLFAAVFVVSYLAFGVPTLIAGELIGAVGLRNTAVMYGVVTILGAASGLFVQCDARRWRNACGRAAHCTQPVYL
jgi:predicted MFS family arabinose efflux permease